MILDHVYNNNSIEYPMVMIYCFLYSGFFRWFFPDLNLVVMLQVVNPTYSVSIRCCYTTAIEKKVGRDPEKNGLTGQMSVLGWYVRLSSEFMALECVRAM